GFSQMPPFDPHRIAQIQREQAIEPVPRDMRPLPTTLESVVAPGAVPAPRPYIKSTTQPIGPEVRMTLQEIIHRTVANNLEVRVAGYQSAIDEVRILEAEAHFDPEVFVNSQAQRSYPQGIGGGNLNPLKIDSQNLEAGIRQQLTTGGQMELKYQ